MSGLYPGQITSGKWMGTQNHEVTIGKDLICSKQLNLKENL